MSTRRAGVRWKLHPIVTITLGLTTAWQLGCGGRADQPVKDQPLAEQVASEKSEDGSEPAGDATSDSTVSIATPANFDLLWEVDSSEHGDLYAIDFAPRGDTLAVGGRLVSLWHPGETKPFAELNEATVDFNFLQTVKALGYSPDGALLAMGCDDGSLRIWSFAEEKLTVRIDAHSEGVTGLAFSPDGLHVATTGQDREVRIWRADSGAQVTALTTDDDRLSAVAYSPKGGLLAACGKVATVWSLADGKVLHVYKDDLAFRIPDVAFSPDGNQLAIAEMAMKGTLWDVAAWEMKATLTGHEGPLSLVAYSSDGTLIATAAQEYTVRIWGAGDGALMQTISTEINGTTETPRDLAWSADGYLLAVVTDMGKIRIWGPAKAAFSSRPVEDSVPAKSTFPDPPAEVISVESVGPEPATTYDALQVIDLRTFPRPKGLEEANATGTQLFYSGENDAEQIRGFYADELTKAGWTDATAVIEGGVEVGHRTFEKDGYRLELNAGGSTVSLRNVGNYAVSRLPRYPDAEDVTADGSMNATQATIVDVEAFLYRELRAQGWIARTRLNSSGTEEPNDRSLRFSRNGTLADYFISAHSRGYPDKTLVQASISLAEDSLPVPSEAEWIEVDDTNRAMCFNCPLSVTQLADYYRAQMPTIGWTPLGDGQQSDSGASLSYLRGDDLLEVRLTATPEGTRAQVGDVRNHLSWIMQVAGGRTSVVDNTVGADEPKNGGIEAADVPIPQDATKVKRKRQSGVIQFETALSPKEAAAFYLEAMKALGWKEGDNNLVDDNFVRIGWTQGDAELGMRASTSGVNLSGNGVLWSKAIPDDELLISFELWLKRNGHMPGLQRLDDYVQEMKPRTLKEER